MYYNTRRHIREVVLIVTAVTSVNFIISFSSFLLLLWIRASGLFEIGINFRKKESLKLAGLPGRERRPSQCLYLYGSIYIKARTYKHFYIRILTYDPSVRAAEAIKHLRP
jgi:hypothetical protein